MPVPDRLDSDRDLDVRAAIAAASREPRRRDTWPPLMEGRSPLWQQEPNERSEFSVATYA